MRLLLDTHILLWWMKEPDRIAEAARTGIRDPSNTVYYSAVNIWEIVIKSSMAKRPNLRRDEVMNALQEDHVLPLPVSPVHA